MTQEKQATQAALPGTPQASGAGFSEVQARLRAQDQLAKNAAMRYGQFPSNTVGTTDRALAQQIARSPEQWI